jgi:acyl dehydratase
MNPQPIVRRMTTITGLDELNALEGKDLGTSEWHKVTQKDIDQFAEVTGDHQWIHVDVKRAKDTPFGGTIAHGYYTLSLAPKFSEEIFQLQGFAFGINYGLNRVRFPAPVFVGGKVRMQANVKAVEPIEGGAQLTLQLTFEHDRSEKPVCVAETVARVYTG